MSLGNRYDGVNAINSRSSGGEDLVLGRRELDFVLDALADLVDKAQQYFSNLDGETVVQVGEWGPAEVLGHLVWWHRANSEGLDSVLAGGPPNGAGESTEELNARAMDEMAGRRVIDLLCEWECLQNQVEEKARALADPEVVVRIYRDGTPRTLVERIEELAGHIAEHLEELRR